MWQVKERGTMFMTFSTQCDWLLAKAFLEFYSPRWSTGSQRTETGVCVDVPTHQREDCECRISSHCMLPLPTEYATHLTRREPLKRCLLFPEDLKVHMCISLDDSTLPSQLCRFDLSLPVPRGGKSWTRVGVGRHPCCSWGSQSRWLWRCAWQCWLSVWCFSAYLSIRKIECNLRRYHEGSS